MIINVYLHNAFDLDAFYRIHFFSILDKPLMKLGVLKCLAIVNI